MLIGGSLSAIPTVTSAAEMESEVVGAVSGDFKYSLYGGFDDFSTYYEYACITGYSGTATNLEIPSTIDGYTVEAIGYNAFEDCTSLVSVTIPDSVREIYTAVFCNCENLESITVDKANPEFSSMDGVLFNKDQTNLIFYPMSKKQQEYTVPITVKKISYKAFYEAKNLESVEISDNVASIGEYAFYWAENLNNVVFSENIDFIGNGAFSGTDWYNNQKDGVIYINRCLYRYKGEMPENTSITIKDGTKSICDNAFSYRSNLINVEFPNSVTYIGERAFANCENLKSINIPEQLTKTGQGVFDDCTNLETVYFNAIASSDDDDISFSFSFENSVKTVIYGDKVTKVASDFEYNTGLEQVVLGSNVKSIGNSAFSACTSLKSITIPENVTEIGNSAFSACTGLTNITIPESVTEIGYSAFENCTNLSDLQIPSNIEKIGDGAFDNTAWYENQPDGLLYIGKVLYAYKGDKAAVTDVKINEGTKSILSGVFSECSNLKNVVIPDSVISIGSLVFSSCTSLTSITVPESVSSLGAGLFRGCTSLKSAKLPSNVTGSFLGTFDGCENLESVNIPNGVTGLQSTFEGCKKLKSIIIPENVTGIYRRTFADCTSLESIVIPKNVSYVAQDAFSGCTSLKSLTVDSDNENYYSIDSLLYSKKDKKLIYYPEGKDDENIKLPDGVEKIGPLALYNCKSIKSIDLPNTVTEIMYSAFQGCSSLAYVNIPESVKSIGTPWNGNAFSNCPNLKAVTIPSSVEIIREHSFGYNGYFDSEKGEYVSETVDNFTILGKSGTAAETYANENSFTFIDLDNKNYNHTDNNSGIGVIAKADAELVVKELSDKENLDKIKSLFDNNESILNVYDITLSKNGNKVQHEGMAEVSILCKDENAKVYRVESDNTLTDMQAVYKDGYLKFYTEHFSDYVVASPRKSVLGDVNNDNEVNAKDRMMLTRYLAKWTGYENIDMTAADVNNDGEVNAKDRMILTRHLAKWQGYETLPFDKI